MAGKQREAHLNLIHKTPFSILTKEQRTIRPPLQYGSTGWHHGPRRLSYRVAVQLVHAGFWIRIKTEKYVFTGEGWMCGDQNWTIEKFKSILRQKHGKFLHCRHVASAYVDMPKTGQVRGKHTGRSASRQIVRERSPRETLRA